MKGNLQLIFNDDKTSAAVTFTPSEEGEEWTENRIKALLETEGVKEGIKPGSIEKAAREIVAAKEEITFTIAESEAPVSKSEGSFEWKSLKIPHELIPDAERIFKVAFTPEITQNIEKNIKVRKKVQKKSKLPFGKSKVESITVIEKKIFKEPVKVDPEIIMTGWADAGDILAERGEAEEGKPGVSVLGEQLESGKSDFYTGKGVKSEGRELIAEYSGFIRRGKNWIEIIPFKHQSWTVSLSKDKSTPLLKILPDAQNLTMPSTDSIVAKAVALGIPEDKIINKSLITRIVNETVSSGSLLEDFPLIVDQDASFSITTSEDRIRGFLNMKKGRGNGKALKLNEIGEAIKKSGFAGLNFQKIKKDILTFYKSPLLEMKDYILAEGKLPEMGEETTFSIECDMMKPKELETHKKEIEDAYAKRK
ncbi:MAG: FapA family protein, partial [Spirochaetales bacterium]|nr:FapA family protein [Spirochaetales bacterium]